jgi:hypothetical protein
LTQSCVSSKAALNTRKWGHSVAADVSSVSYTALGFRMQVAGLS